MAQAPKKNSSVVTIRATKTIALAPGTLGFSSLITPDDYDPEKPQFKLNHHLSPEAIEQMAELIREKVYTQDSLKRLTEEAIKAGFFSKAEVDKAEKAGKSLTLKDPQDPSDWLASKLKDPREKDTNQLPYMVVANRATYKARENGDLVTKERKMGCWDARNTKLDLSKLRLGRGSLIAPVVYPNLFISKLVGFPQPSLKLVGIKVLKLERFGGGGGSQEAETDEESIREVLGEDFAFEDLAAYAAGGDRDEDEEEDSEGMAPEDEAARLFGGS